MKILYRIVNYILFYVGWGFCVNKASQGDPYSGPLLIGGILILHLLTSGEKRGMEAILLLSVAFLGSLTDTFYIHYGLISYQSNDYSWIAPLWVTSLWGLFAICINHSFNWLKSRWILASTLGGLGGILSYVATERMGAIEFIQSDAIVFSTIGIAWAAIFPLSLAYGNWLVKESSFKRTHTY